MSPRKARSMLATLLAVLLVVSCGQGAVRAPSATGISGPAEAQPSPTRQVPPASRPAIEETQLPPAPTPGASHVFPPAAEKSRLPLALPSVSPSSPALSSPAPTEPNSPAPSPSAAETRLAGHPISAGNAGRVALLGRLGRGALQDMAWLPGGQAVVVAHYAGLSVHAVPALEEQRFMPTYGWKAGLAASPDGRHVALITEAGLQLWNVASGQLVQTLTEPRAGVKRVAFGGRGETLAILGSEAVDGRSGDIISVLDLSGLLGGAAGEAQEIYRLSGWATALSGMAFSPDGRYLVTSRQTDWDAPNEPTLALWDAADGESLPVVGEWGTAPGGLEELAFSPDGRLLAGAYISTLYAWDVASGRLLATFENGVAADTLAWSADARLLAAGSSDGVVQVWDLATTSPKVTLAGHTAALIRVAFDPAPPGAAEVLLATATARDGVQLWAAETGQRRVAQPQAGPTGDVTAIAYSPDGRLLATASTDETIWLLDAASGRPQMKMDAAETGTESQSACFWSLAFSPDGETLAAGSSDGVVRIWDAKTGQLLERAGGPTDLVYSLAFSADGQRLAAGDADGHLLAWDLTAPLSAGPLFSLDNPPTVLSVAFEPSWSQGEYVLATGSGFGAIRVWDLGTGSLLREMQAGGNGVRAIYSPAGELLAAGKSGYEPDYEIDLWDPDGGEVQQVLQGHDHDVNALAFSPDGAVLASGDAEGIIRLWDVATGGLLRDLDQGWRVYGLAFRPDGRQLASGGSDGLIWIWGIPLD